MAAPSIHIVGGGLVGPLAAIYLARKGFSVTIYERRPDMRRTDIAAGRSINLAVTARGLKALEEVGLRDKVMEIAIPMKGRMIHDQQGNTSLQPYGQKEHEVIYAASRGLLNILLLNEAESAGNIKIIFDAPCTHYDPKSGTLTVGEKKIRADVVIGADGAGSAVRKALGLSHTVESLEYGYKELVIPPAVNGGFAMEKNALHIWPRSKYMLIALPNTDGSFTGTLFYPYAGADSFASLKTADDVRAFFKRDFPDALKLMPALADDFFAHPTGALTTIRCAPWHAGGKACLIGDAAHGIVPFFAQGMNSGFEDCAALNGLINSPSPNWNSVFAQFEALRKPNTDAIAAMAVENFVEMRDKVNDPRFILRKQVGFELEKRWPGRFIPRYSMVIFHPEIPYAEAKRRSETQDRLLDDLCADIATLEQVDWSKAGRLINLEIQAARQQ